MAQHDYVIDNSTGANVRADINNALQAIVTNNSGSSAPSATFPFMLFADSSAGTMKIRNAADNAFIELFQLDGTFTLEDGSASTPGLAFRDDLNTGIFQPGNNQLAVSCNGTEVVEFGTAEAVFNDTGADIDFRIEGDTVTHLFYVDAGNDRVGINTNTPLGILGVNGTGTSGSTASAGYDEFVIEGGNVDIGMCFLSPAANNKTQTIAFGDSNNNKSGRIRYVHANDNFIFDTGGSERVRIDSSGNVMIGLTSTSNKFHVEGTTTGSRFGVDDSASGITALAITNEVNADFEHVIFSSKASFGSSVNIPICFHTNGKANEKMRLDTSGRLLVNHTSARQVSGGLALIHIESNDHQGRLNIVQNRNEAGSAGFVSLGKSRGTSVSASTIVQNGDVLGTISFAGADGNGMDSAAASIVGICDGTAGANDMPGALLFMTSDDGSSNPTEFMRITHYKTLGIFDTNPSSAYLVDVKFSAGAKGCVRLQNHSFYTNQHALEIVNGDDNNARTMADVKFTRNGNQVGSISLSTTGTTYNTSSDYRLKENATAISDGITRLKTLKPYRFNFKSDVSKTVDGFFAHEVTAVPEAISGEKDAVNKDGSINAQLLDQSKLVPLLVAAVQELIGKVEALEAA